MRNRTRTIAVAAVMTAIVGGSTAAVASTTGAKPPAAKSAAARSAAAGAKSHGSTAAADRQGHDQMTASVARMLHVTTARAAAALQPLFAAGHADTSSPAFAAAARSLGVSPQQLNAALGQAKQSLAVHR
jgi:2-hydroxychromene-2-carboxylate isomerase